MKTRSFVLCLAALCGGVTGSLQAQGVRDRGLSVVESQAVGQVVDQVSRASAPSGQTSAAPTRRYSPDYYRVYSRRQQQQAGAAQRVAVAAAPKPAASVVATPTPKPATPLPRRVVAAPTVAPVRWSFRAATPSATPVQANAPRRVVMLPTPQPAPRQLPPPARQAPVVKVKPAPPMNAPLAPRRVVMLPRATPAPAPARVPQAPPAAQRPLPRRVAMLPTPVPPPAVVAPAKRQRGVAPTPTPARVLFRQPGQS